MSTVFHGEGKMSTVVHRLQFFAARARCPQLSTDYSFSRRGQDVHSCPQITVFRGEGRNVHSCPQSTVFFLAGIWKIVVRVMDKESMIIIYYLYLIIIYIIIYQYIIKYINNNIFNRSFLFSLHLSPKVGYRKKTVICGLWTFLSHRELRFIHLSTPQRHPFHKNRMPPFLQNCPQLSTDYSFPRRGYKTPKCIKNTISPRVSGSCHCSFE